MTSASSGYMPGPKEQTSIPQQFDIPIPLSPTEWAKIQTSGPLGEKSWEQFIKVLNALKPGLVWSITEQENAKEKKED